jgi:acyl dehydratase
MTMALPPTRTFDDVEVGQSLPDLSVEIDTALIVATAVATRDFQDVHHDKDRARALGSPDVFMNILTTNGFVGRFVTDWAGPNAVVRSIAIRLGVPNYPGDTMRMTGSVTAKEVVEGEGIVEVEVRGANRLGDHVTGTVRLVLPRTGKATS